MNKDYSALKKGMKEHITATVMGSDGNRKSWAKLDSGRQVVFNDHSAVRGVFSIDSKDFTIAAARITIRDYSDYDSNLCHDGGHYATGVTFIRRPDGWERREYTSGDYCPYCGSFDCCGSCEEAEAAEAERLTDSEVMDEVDHYKGQADTAIMYQPA